jgi:hypothetical protein
VKITLFGLSYYRIKLGFVPTLGKGAFEPISKISQPSHKASLNILTILTKKVFVKFFGHITPLVSIQVLYQKEELLSNFGCLGFR